ncbi:MAG: DsbA family protein [Holosporaceae bacterium]|jgi:protein-disulfide isomerase|nr:DsbA family protein [Holosporaceae bacterium]
MTLERETDTFSENLAKLEFPESFMLKEIVIGNENAPLTVIIYSSFTCDHCRDFHLKEFPKFKKKYIDTGKVKVYLRCYLDDLGAFESASLMRCLAGEDIKKITKAYHDIFSQQSAWKKSKDPRTYLKNIFLNQKYTLEDVDACLENRKVQAGLMKEQQRAMIGMRIISMPAFVIGENIHQGILNAEELAEMCGLQDSSLSTLDKTTL